jgi:hypothetical protein
LQRLAIEREGDGLFTVEQCAAGVQTCALPIFSWKKNTFFTVFTAFSLVFLNDTLVPSICSFKDFLLPNDFILPSLQ